MKKYGKLEVITTGNGSSDYYGNFTKIEKKLIKENLRNGKTIHFFSGNSMLGNKRIDINSKSNANLVMDIFEYINLQETFNESNEIEIKNYSNLIIDAPYNKKFAKKYAKCYNGDIKNQFIIFASVKKTTKLFDYVSNVLKPKRIILKSWNWYIPKGYKFNKGWLCYAGGYRKPTILLVIDKI